jgi:hypothetical protein
MNFMGREAAVFAWIGKSQVGLFFRRACLVCRRKHCRKAETAGPRAAEPAAFA